jgi:RNA polymerase sigma-70 factor (ECF subfamily)
LPPAARGVVDTDDLVQMALLGTFQKWEEFEPDHPGALFGYLRRALLHRIRDELRRVRARPGHVALPGSVEAEGPSPLELAVTREGIERYEAALGRLPEMQREAVLLRLELGASYPEIAAALGSPSPNAARMMVVRALLRLAEAIDA